MATLVFSAVGTLVGGPLGGAIGALIGRQVDAAVLGGGTRQGARLTELAASTSSYGVPIARQFGTVRVAGQIIWATDLAERSERHGNGKGAPTTVAYTYSASFAVALSSRPIAGIGRIWADGTLLRGAGGDLKVGGTLRIHHGFGDQPADPLLAATEAGGCCPAYRGLAYLVFEDLQLADFGNRIPALTVEVLGDETPPTLAALTEGTIAQCDASASLAPLAGLSLDGPLADLFGTLDPVLSLACDAGSETLRLVAGDAGLPATALSPAAIAHGADDFGGAAGFVRDRAGSDEAPLAVLRYYDLARDFLPGSQRASGAAQPGQPRTLDLPAALTADGARALIDAAARRTRWRRESLTWRVAAIDPAVRPGALVTVPGQPGHWQVRSWEWRASGIELTLLRQPPLLPAGPRPADPGRALPAADEPGGPTVLAACELPWDGQAATPAPVLFAAASSPAPGWAGAALYLDPGSGALVPVGAAGRTRAVIGTALDALPPRSPLLFDRHSGVTIQLAAPDLALTAATPDQLAAGANRAVLGEELIQFATAEALGSGQWRLGGLLRGRAGTEGAIAGHAAGERFILLDGPGAVIDPAGQPPALLAALGLGDAAPVTTPVALAGIGTRPLAPVHGWLDRTADGGLVLRWTRRARGAWHWSESLAVPLGEQGERYGVALVVAGTATGQWDVAEPQLVLPPGAPGTGASLPAGSHFAVCQIGDRAVSAPLLIPAG